MGSELQGNVRLRRTVTEIKLPVKVEMDLADGIKAGGFE